MRNGAQQYKKTSITTASNTQILILLYEAAIRNVKKASDCIDAKDMAGKGVAIVRSHDIINELANTLNFEVGGDIAHELNRLYNFCIDQLVKANAENDKKALEAVAKVLENLLEGWRGAISQLSSKKVP